ncbi:MAG: hypothetical protein E6J03_13500, partial [Chloroflexi bacterium]
MAGTSCAQCSRTRSEAAGRPHATPPHSADPVQETTTMTAATTPPHLTTDPETTERLRRCVLRAVAAAHELVRELRLTEPELHALVRFLTEVGTADEFMLLS